MKSDIKLNQYWDIDITNGDVTLLYNDDYITQKTKQVFKTIKGEWFLDADIGVPFLADVLGTSLDEDVLRNIITNAVMDVDGVKLIKSITFDFDAKTRNISVNCKIETVNNTIININDTQLNNG